jgi:hypothetical protein
MAKAKTAKPPFGVERRGKKPTVVPVAPAVPEVSPVDPPVASSAPVEVIADAVGTPEGAEPPEKPNHYIPKPTFILMDDGRVRERRFDHSRTVTIDGVQYEHVTEDAQGHWVYAKS